MLAFNKASTCLCIYSVKYMIVINHLMNIILVQIEPILFVTLHYGAYCINLFLVSCSHIHLSS